MQDSQDRIDPKDMTPAQAHAEALRRIEAAAESGQDWLDLGDLPLAAIPQEIGRLAGQLRQLGLGYLRYDTQSLDWNYEYKRRMVPRSLHDLRPLAQLSALELLDLSGCKQLTSLAPVAGLTALQKLNLIGCEQLTSLAPVAGLTALQTLDLSECEQLSSLAPVAGLTALQTLDLSGCEQLTSLAPVAGLTALKALDLSGCEQLTSLNPVAGLTALQSLDLSWCKQLTSLEPVAGLTALQSLDLSWCKQLTSFEPIAGLTALQTLNLSGCKQLTSLEPVAGLNALQTLYLSWCEQLTFLEPVAGLTALQALTLTGCEQLTSLEPIAGLTALQLLYLSGCKQLTSLEPVAGLSVLQTLDLNWCEQLTSLEPAAGLTALQTLDLIGCKQLTSLEPVAGLTALQTLNFSGCEQLTSLAPVAGLRALTALDLYGVTISADLQAGTLFEQWPTLSSLVTARLHATPSEVLSNYHGDNCLPRVTQWWHDLQQGEANTHELKLFILGNGRVGKSELFRRLRGDAFHGDLPSTHGIQLGRFELCRHHDDRPIFLNAWDFGGQDVYLGTHALFLKSRAIFVLAWHPDMETEAPYTETVSGLQMRHRPLQYWLDYVHSLAGDEARVIVVQTRCALESDEAAPPLQGTERLAWYQRTISCAHRDDGVDSLRDLLKRAARHRLETPAPPRMPASWLAVRDRLATLRETERTLERARFDAICAETHHGASAYALLHYLHQSGDVFHQPGLFGDAIVLDQQWALDGIYTLFDRGRVLPLLRGSGGVFAPELLDALAWNGHYSAKEQALLLSMMESCDLIFRIDQRQNNASYAMIDALPDAAASASRIAMVWPADAQVVEAVADYAFLHEGVLRALLARIGRLAGRDAVYWRHGVCLYDAGTASRARIDTEQRADGSGRVRMRASGRDADALCARLIKWLKDIRIGEPPVITGEGATARPSPHHSAPETEREPLQPAPIPPLPGQKPVVYVSYAWGGADRKDLKDFAVQLHRALEDEFDVRRDEEATRPGDRISEFMREIGRGARVLVLLSDKYLKSPNCMSELLHLYHRHLENAPDLQRHVLPLILDSGLTGTAKQRLGYVRFWKQRLIELKEAADGLDPVECLPTHHEMRMIEEFRLKTEEMLTFLNDILMPRGVTDLSMDDFSGVRTALRRLGEVAQD